MSTWWNLCISKPMPRFLVAGDWPRRASRRCKLGSSSPRGTPSSSGYVLRTRLGFLCLHRAPKAAQEGITFSNGLINTVGCGCSLQIYYDGLQLPQAKLIDYLVSLEEELGDTRSMRISNRTFALPLVFNHPKITAAIERYMTNQRPYASFLPDNFDFVAKNNGISRDQLKPILLKAEFVAVGVGFVTALPQCLPVDPRHRLRSPKMNPFRTFTPAGAVSWGGSCMALYNSDVPGGYMLTGLTIPGVDIMGIKEGYSPDRPWLLKKWTSSRSKKLPRTSTRKK